MKRFLAIIISAAVMLPVLSSCGDGGTPSEQPSQNESSVASGSESLSIAITIGDTPITVDTVNSKGNISIFNRDYRIDGKYIYTLTAADGETLISIKRTQNGGSFAYSVNGAAVKGEKLAIPVNGFVIAAESSFFTNTSLKNGTKLVCDGYSGEPTYERFDLSSVIPDDKALARRVNLLYSQDIELSEGKLYLVSDADTLTVPENACALLMKKNVSSTYTVTGTASSGTVLKETYALLFTGGYNVGYCEEFYAGRIGEKVTLAREDLLNSISDTAALVINNATYPVDEDRFNAADAADGIFIFTNDFDRLTTPEMSNDFICAVVSDENVVYISDKNERIVIPTDSSYAVVFAGEAYLSKFDSLSVGDGITSLLFSVSSKPDMFILSEGKTAAFNGIDSQCDAGSAILYTSFYGETTGCAAGCLEIAFNNGTILSLSTDGNAAIPKGGYVLSFDKTSAGYRIASQLAAGSEIAVSSGANKYSTETLKYTRINGTRNTDELIIYNGSAGKTTGTNVYGFEISVDADGIVCAGGTEGNFTIPDGGYVISGHGVNSDALREAYELGMSASIDTTNQTVTFRKSPALKLVNAAFTLDSVKTAFENAKKQLYSIDYSNISSLIDSIDDMYKNAYSQYQNGSPDAAVSAAVNINAALDKLSFRLYESSPVENRSVWYRASEKNDEEVEATVKKMAEMNINAVYIETWYNGMTIGYVSDSRVLHNSAAHGSYDALKGFCRIAHEYGIEVHAWCENFFIGTSGSLVDEMKGHYSLDRNGKDNYPCGYGNFIFMNPNDRECRDLVLGVYRDLLTKYDLDGIHLDYIRFSEPNPNNGDFGYNDDIIAGFQKEYDTDIDPHTIFDGDALWTKWCRYREDIINSFVKEVYDLVRSIDRGISISAACYPDIYNVNKWNFQNCREWASNGWIDEIFSMSYGSELSYPLGNAKDFISALGEKCWYSIGVSAFETTAADILVAQMFQSKLAGASGANAFSWGSLINHSENYFSALTAGLYSKPSVKLNKGSVTVAAGLKGVLSDVDKVYRALLPDYEGYYTELVTRLKAVIEKADGMDYAALSSNEKLVYCESALVDIKELISFAGTAPDSSLKTALKRNLTVLKKALSISINRLKAEN